MKFLLLFALLTLCSGHPHESPRIAPSLLSASPLATFNIIISFKEGTEDILQSIDETRFDTVEERRIIMTMTLNQRAQLSQQASIQYLSTIGKRYMTLWITNQLYTQGVTVSEIIALSKLPSVSEIAEELIIPLEDPLPNSEIIYGRQEQPEWGILMIKAQEANQLLINATTGRAPNEVRIATIDTGVRGTHEALKNNYLGNEGNYGWFDPYEQTLEPNDQNGHGTHTTGTICGKGGIGVYPQAKWLACKGCATSACNQLALLACAQFMICPTTPTGDSPDCSNAPHLVSNSWGGGQNSSWFDSAIAAFHTAKIIPLFSQGNSGPSCGTASSPGDRDVIGVGSTTEEDAISSFSSVGPTKDGRMKPEISAPGSNVFSAYHTSDDAYRSLSGTSMACPHAAGLVALLKAFDPELPYEAVVKFMKENADIEGLKTSGRVCDGVPDHLFPNHVFGHGRINAFNSLEALINN